MRTLTRLPWLLPALFAAAAWYVATARIMRATGAEEAATAAGLIVAFAIAVSLWRWEQRDFDRDALTAERCPRCARDLPPEHDHASPGGLRRGLVHWQCAHCGYGRSEALTCPSCAP